MNKVKWLVWCWMISFGAQAAEEWIELDCSGVIQKYRCFAANGEKGGDFYVNENTRMSDNISSIGVYATNIVDKTKEKSILFSDTTLKISNIEHKDNLENKMRLITTVTILVTDTLADKIELTGNKIIVSNSKATEIVGTKVRQGNGTILLNNNTVELNNGTEVTNVYGSYADLKGEQKVIEINNNQVSINGNEFKIDVKGKIYGGFVDFVEGDASLPTDFDIVTGNTFNFNDKEKGTANIKVAEMGNFETYNIFLNGDGDSYFKENGSKETALISVTDYFGNQDGSKANLVIENQAMTKDSFKDVEKGDKFYILSMGNDVEYGAGAGTFLKDNLAINQYNDNALSEGQFTLNVGTIYSLDAELILDENSVFISTGDPDSTFVDENAIDRNSPVLDSKLAALSVLNSGNNLSSDILIGIEPTKQGEVIAFGKVSGEHNKAKGTSDIHINGVNAILGAGVSLSDKTILGGYFEYGYGHYDSTRDFDGYTLDKTEFSAMNYKGKGNVNYQGLGALVKYYANDNVYVNGGVKVGLIDTNYSSTSFTDYDYRASNMDYSKRKLYVGAQIGTGFKAQLSENTNLNSSINFIYSQIGGDSFVIDDSEIKLNKVKSERLVLTESLKYYINESIGLKLSGAFDYEFRSIAEGTVDGYKMTNSSMRGASVVLGTGILFTPFSDKENQYFDLSLNASTGKNNSLGGSLRFNYNF